jgi:hypothetical protein
MKKSEWITIIAIMIVIAVVVSLLTVNMTGNAIFGFGKSPAKQDKLNINLNEQQESEPSFSYKGVLYMLRDKCIWVSAMFIAQPNEYTKLSDICQAYNDYYNRTTICIFGRDANNTLLDCNLGTAYDTWKFKARCCSP